MWRLKSANSVYKLYEMLGLYNNSPNKTINDFLEYYNENVGKTKFHYANKGQIFVKNSLANKGVNVTRRSLRWMSQTYKCCAVCSTSEMDCILEELTLIYTSNPVLLKAAMKHIDCFSKDRIGSIEHKMLHFQYQSVLVYLDFTPSSNRMKKRHNIINRVLNSWRYSCGQFIATFLSEVS